MMETTKTVYFDATLTPSRSLSPRAFAVVMTITVGVSFVAGMSFVAMGAFPVIGFFGIDAIAIWLAFRWSFRKQKQETRIHVTADRVDISHTQPGKIPRQVSLPTAFARISLEFPDRQPSELKISHADNAWIIGRFLTPDERKSLRQALETAIHRAKMERYPA